jgi:nucleoside-diphosphate-sugar epimerase
LLRIVVTGGEGYIGSCLVRALLKKPDMMITTLDLGSRRYGMRQLQAKVSPRLRLVRGDISDGKSARRALSKGVDVVVHLAAIPNPAKCEAEPGRALRTNISGTDAVLRESSRHDPLFIFASSQTIYGDASGPPANETLSPEPRDLYSLTKLAGESMVRGYHRAGMVRGVVLRVSSVYGVGARTNLEQIPGRMVADCISKGIITLVSSTNIHRPGGQIVDLVHVRDVCDAIANVIEKGDRVAGHCFNISSGKGFSVRRVAQLVAKIATEKGIAQSIRYRRAFRSVHMTPRLVLSNSKARSMVEWDPKIQLRKGIEELFDYVQAAHTNELVSCG